MPDDQAMTVDAAKRITLNAGKLAMSHFERLADIPVESKGHLDLVTEADKGVENYLITELQQAYPDDGVYGEEGGDVTGKSGRVWVVDPIDGTFNFVRGGDQWAISVGLYEGGKPVFGIIHLPVTGKTYVGGRNHPATLNGESLTPITALDRSRAAAGVGFHPVIPIDDRMRILDHIWREAGLVMRCCGSATVSLMELATGQTDGYIGMGESSWDLMAALPILETLGFQSTVDWEAADLTSKFKFAVGTPDFLKLVEPVMPYGSRF